MRTSDGTQHTSPSHHITTTTPQWAWKVRSRQHQVGKDVRVGSVVPPFSYTTDRKPHPKRRSRHAIHEKLGVFSLRRPSLHTPNTQTYPIWVHFVFGVNIIQKFVDDGRTSSPSSEVFPPSLF